MWGNRKHSVQRSTTVTHRTTLFHEAQEIVEDEFGADLSLDEIARRVASSRRQLQRAYAEIGGTTFREALTAVRMHRAAELLSAGRLSVREVAGRVGYRQPAQFAKAFRRATGVAPSEYRSHPAAAPALEPPTPVGRPFASGAIAAAASPSTV